MYSIDSKGNIICHSSMNDDSYTGAYSIGKNGEIIHSSQPPQGYYQVKNGKGYTDGNGHYWYPKYGSTSKGPGEHIQKEHNYSDYDFDGDRPVRMDNRQRIDLNNVIDEQTEEVGPAWGKRRNGPGDNRERFVHVDDGEVYDIDLNRKEASDLKKDLKGHHSKGVIYAK